jgi:tetratricopeptide (TPR) repeat protein
MKKFLLLVIIVAGYALTKPSLTIPYPYTFLDSAPIGDSVHVLIIGDEFAKSLDHLTVDTIIKKVSPYMAYPLTVVNLGATNEGLHRSLAKVKRFKKLPPVVIYAGGLNESYEVKFDPKDRKKILKNFKYYTIAKNIVTKHPFLSRFIYFRMNRKKLDQIMAKNTESDIFQDMEVIISLFQNEFNQLQDYITAQGSTLITVSLPINRLLPPRKICGYNFYDNYSARINDAREQLLRGNYQQSYKILDEIIKYYPSHSDVYYLMGMSLLGLGQNQESYNYLNMAVGLDCSLWRGNPIFNTISKKLSNDYLDFDELIPFTDYQNNRLYPPARYYRQLGDILSDRVIGILRLGRK